MGDIADYDIEQGMDQWFDHLNGHHAFPADDCQYCEDEMKKNVIAKKRKANEGT